MRISLQMPTIFLEALRKGAVSAVLESWTKILFAVFEHAIFGDYIKFFSAFLHFSINLAHGFAIDFGALTR